MKNIVRLKISFLTVLLLIGSCSIGANTHYTMLIPLIGVGVSIVMTVLLVSLFSKLFNSKLEKPKWNDRVLKRSHPLAFSQFIGLSFVSFGLGKNLGQILRDNDFSQFGILFLSCGIGVILGTQLSLLFKKQVNK